MDLPFFSCNSASSIIAGEVAINQMPRCTQIEIAGSAVSGRHCTVPPSCKVLMALSSTFNNSANVRIGIPSTERGTQASSRSTCSLPVRINETNTVTSASDPRNAASFSARAMVCAIRRPTAATAGTCSTLLQCWDVCVKRSQVTHASGTSRITAERSGMAIHGSAVAIAERFQWKSVQATAPQTASRTRMTRKRRMGDQRYRGA